MRAVLCGANGAMGKLIDGLLGAEIVGRVSIDGENNVPRTFGELGMVDADVVIDFSHHTAVGDVLAYAKVIGAAAVIGTTGHTAQEKAMITAAAEEIKLRSRQYAKRQLTWFRRNKTAKWLVWGEKPDFTAALRNSTEYMEEFGIV